MKTSKQLREEIAALMGRVEAITTVAKDEDRELTPEEKAEIDAIMGAGDAPGQIGNLEIELKRILKIEAKQAEFAERHAPDGPETPNDPAPVDRAASITIPIQARHQYNTLRAFEGPHAEERAFISGMWALATLGRHEGAQVWCREHGIDTQYHRTLFESPQAAHSTTAVEKGGYLVPDEMESSIIRLREIYGVFRRNARISPMGSDTKSVPVRSAGLTAYWGKENPASAMTESEMTYKNAELVAKKLYAFSRFSTEISEDAIINFGDELAEEAALAIAYKEDQAAFLGDGTSTYGGVVGLITALLAGSEVTALAGNTAFSTLDLVDFETMVGALPEFAGIQPRWFISKKGWAASMLRLIDAAGGNTAAMLGGEKRAPEFLGFPVEFTQVMNSTLTAQVSTEGLCHFGDLRMGTLLGDRRGIAMMISDQRYFELDQLAIRVTTRADIVVHGTGTASAAGPIIQLLTPGS
jgi:HK97 family phage major capsid protein